MPKAKILNSHIFNTGTKFVVTDETTDGSFGPGTTGFVSYVKGKDRDFSNVVYLKAAIVQRGKTGKERLDFCEISTPIFEIPDQDMATFMPDEKRRYYVHIKHAEDSVRSIVDMEEIDFLGWALSYAQYVFKLNSRAKRISVWPQDNNAVCNKMLNLCEYYAEDADHTKESMANIAARHSFVQNIRMQESTLVKCCLSYMMKVAQIEAQAINAILARFPESALLEDSAKAFSEKAGVLEAMNTLHGKKAAPLNEFAKGVSWS
mgnify:CR=1 FL=1